jgi:DNA polymerase elongation subunit (family B)
MVKLPTRDLTVLRRLGNSIVKRVNEESGLFQKPMELDFENIKMPFLLEGKKKYAAQKFDKAKDEPPVLVSKGLETVRRDTPLYASDSLEELLHVMLIGTENKTEEQLQNELVAVARSKIQALLANKVDLEQLIISKEIKKPFDEYKAATAHIEVAKKVNATGKFAPLGPGDRVEMYYIAVPGRDVKVLDQAISSKMYDPVKDALDFELYSRYLLKPFARALTLVLEPDQLANVMDLNSYMIAKPNPNLVSPLARAFKKEGLPVYARIAHSPFRYYVQNPAKKTSGRVKLQHVLKF